MPMFISFKVSHRDTNRIVLCHTLRPVRVATRNSPWQVGWQFHSVPPGTVAVVSQWHPKVNRMCDEEMPQCGPETIRAIVPGTVPCGSYARAAGRSPVEELLTGIRMPGRIAACLPRVGRRRSMACSSRVRRERNARISLFIIDRDERRGLSHRQIEYNRARKGTTE